MDTPVSGQNVELYIANGGDPDTPAIALGALYTSGARHAYLSVVDNNGGSSGVDVVVPTDNLEHTLEGKFIGNTFYLYLDGALLGSHTAAVPSLQVFTYVQVLESASVTGTSIYIGEIKVSNCPGDQP